MSMTIDFNPQEEAMLAAAARQDGLAPSEFVKNLVKEHLPPVTPSIPDAENQELINLLRSWREEDATDDAQELEHRDADTKAFMSNLESNRLTLPTEEL